MLYIVVCPFSFDYCLVCPFSFDYCLVCPFSFDYCLACPSSFDYCLVCPSSFDYCLVCPSSFDYCLVCPSSIYDFGIFKLFLHKTTYISGEGYIIFRCQLYDVLLLRFIFLVSDLLDKQSTNELIWLQCFIVESFHSNSAVKTSISAISSLKKSLNLNNCLFIVRCSQKAPIKI